MKRRNTGPALFWAALSIGMLGLCTACNPAAHKQHQKTEVSLGAMYNHAMQGDLATVLNMLDTVAVDQLDSSQQATRQAFYNRFRHQQLLSSQEASQLPADVAKLLLWFRQYWAAVMMGQKDELAARQTLRDSAVHLFYTNQYAAQGLTKTIITDSIDHYCQDYLNSRGYHARVGNTAHLYDLFLWQSHVKRDYTVPLIDDTVQVTVYLMDDFVSFGWIGFATLNHAYAGGWATNEALYAVKESYNLNSEKYRISYLGHEGQHFADYKKFPQLKAFDLEYRAKLTELVQADSGFYNLVDKFLSLSNPAPEQPHPFVNYTIMSSLSMQVFGETHVTDIDKWKAADKAMIKAKCLALYHQHTTDLIGQGADTVTNYISRVLGP